MKKILNSKFMPWNSWLSIAICILAPLVWVVASSSTHAKEVTREMNINKLPNGTRVYEVYHNGTTYVVVENHKGVGICKK
jgi:ABC-type glycerol-3-phosphate transport system permease component